MIDADSGDGRRHVGLLRNVPIDGPALKDARHEHQEREKNMQPSSIHRTTNIRSRNMRRDIRFGMLDEFDPNWMTDQPEGAAWWQRFQDLLDDQNAWPAEYVFKFIVPTDQLDDVRTVFGQVRLEERPSRRGRYTSVTARMMIHSSDEVIAVYTAVGRIDGVIAL